MIAMFATKNDVELICIGLQQENVLRIEAGKPAFLELRSVNPKAPDLIITISYNLGVKLLKDADRQIAITFHDETLKNFVKRRMTVVPLPATPTTPKMELMLFYCENPEQFMADLVTSGIQIGEFVDKRGTAS